MNYNYFTDIAVEFKYTFIGVIIGALTFVVGLAWRDLVQAIFEAVGIKEGEELRANIVYTAIVTAVAVLATYFLVKWAEKDPRELVERRGV